MSVAQLAVPGSQVIYCGPLLASGITTNSVVAQTCSMGPYSVYGGAFGVVNSWVQNAVLDGGNGFTVTSSDGFTAARLGNLVLQSWSGIPNIAIPVSPPGGCQLTYTGAVANLVAHLSPQAFLFNYTTTTSEPEVTTTVNYGLATMASSGAGYKIVFSPQSAANFTAGVTVSILPFTFGYLGNGAVLNPEPEPARLEALPAAPKVPEFDTEEAREKVRAIILEEPKKPAPRATATRLASGEYTS